MNLKINYVSIIELSKKLSKENTDFVNSLKDMLKIIEGLNQYWNGIDYENFSINYKNYIKNLNIFADELNYLFSFMKTVGNIYSNVLSFMTLVFDDEKPYDKKLLKAALDVGFTVIGRFGPWGFAASSIYYLLDMYTDGFYFFNE